MSPRAYTMSAAAREQRVAAAKHATRESWTTVRMPSRVRALADSMREPGAPIWRPFADALEKSSQNRNNRK